MAKFKKLHNVDPNTIRRLYWNDDYTTLEIGRKYNVGEGTILGFMKMNNIPRRPNYRISSNAKYALKKINQFINEESQNMSNSLSSQDISIELPQPTTTRGKMMEALEIKREKEQMTILEKRQSRVSKYLDYQKTLELDKTTLELKSIKLTDDIAKIEDEARKLSGLNAILNSTKKNIMKKQIEILELEKQECDIEFATKTAQIEEFKMVGNIVKEAEKMENLRDKMRESIREFTDITNEVTGRIDEIFYQLECKYKKQLDGNNEVTMA